MLVKYRKDYQKIAIGLLSFLPEFRDYDQLATTIKHSLEQNYLIYLWKDTEDNHFIGIIVIEVGREYVLVRQLSFTPTDRSGKNVYALLTAIHEQYPEQRLMGTLRTQPLISNWERNNEK